LSILLKKIYCFYSLKYALSLESFEGFIKDISFSGSNYMPDYSFEMVSSRRIAMGYSKNTENSA